MVWKPDKSRPICPQIVEFISVGISKGEFKSGEKLMSVREVALMAGVNPNTVQKAFEQLKGMGLIISVPSSGWFVSENTSIASEAVERLVEEKTKEYFKEMKLLGKTKEQIKDYIKEWEHE
ncbi:MAG: GntR family transcriptional regulator [Oscillospiraceae bacterium]|nr:GntR family transcriptional regulator [Oscillospiraceae bacterium]